LLATDGGRLQAAVYDAKNELQPGAQLILVPDPARRSRRDQYRVAMSGSDGQALFRGIPPGRYKLFAWQHLEPNAYLNSNYMQLYEEFGVPVNVSPGDNPPVPVRVISVEDR